MPNKDAKVKTLTFFTIFIILFSIAAFMDYEYNIKPKAEEQLMNTVKENPELQYLMQYDFEVISAKRDEHDPSMIHSRVKIGDMEFIAVTKNDYVLRFSFLLHCEKGAKGEQNCYTKLLYKR